MSDKIFVDDLECPHCDWDMYNESDDIEIDQNRRQVTAVTCENCGKDFYVYTDLEICVKKERQ